MTPRSAGVLSTCTLAIKCEACHVEAAAGPAGSRAHRAPFPLLWVFPEHSGGFLPGTISLRVKLHLTEFTILFQENRWEKKWDLKEEICEDTYRTVHAHRSQADLPSRRGTDRSDNVFISSKYTQILLHAVFDNSSVDLSQRMPSLRTQGLLDDSKRRTDTFRPNRPWELRYYLTEAIRHKTNKQTKKRSKQRYGNPERQQVCIVLIAG